MNLHRTENLPQWETVAENKRNIWQKIANTTNGVITPGNMFSLTGLLLVGQGIKDITSGKKLAGIIKIGLGRSLDYADGKAAEATKTKSPMGELIDASFDKIQAGAAFPVFYHSNLAPKSILGIFAAQQLTNASLTAIAKHKDNEIHPSLEGKLSTFGQWSSILLYAMSRIAADETKPVIAHSLDKAAKLTSAVTIVLGSKAIVGYFNDTFPSTNINAEKA